MHLAYSAIITTGNNQHQPFVGHGDQPNDELMLRYTAYQTACDKYSSEIVAIQKYIPGWLPKFR